MNLNHNLPAPAPAGDEPPAPASTQLVKVAAGLALLTFLIFLPVIGYTFVNYDDDYFTTNNPKVAGGLTWEGVRWAFVSTDIDYWRPLSWLSHMLDIELFGAVGGMHHLTNLLIHVAATVMLLLALHRLTKALWPSAIVAALFAWHPLHVESVVWIAERKDVLCGFFWFYTLWAYARYVESPGAGRYVQVLAGFVLGVMSKPMIVTLPCVLLLLDFWPLRRLNPAALVPRWNPNWRREWGIGWTVLKEKLPLFAIVVALSLSTMTAQREVGTMNEAIPLFSRVLNMFAAYAVYLRQTFWPADLCLLYPLRQQMAPWKWAGAVSLCLVPSLGFLLGARRFPFLLVGWLWFLGVLVPTIGLVQVGEQAHADRYTYVPLVGLFLSLVWWAVAWAEAQPRLKPALRWAAIAVLLACAIVTRRQLPHWEDSVHVFKRAIEVDPSNVTAYNNVAAELMAIGRGKEAIPYIERALAIERRPATVWNLGKCYLDLGDFPRASALIAEAFRTEPSPRVANELLGLLRSTIKPNQDNTSQRKLLALALGIRGDYPGAAAALTEVIRTAPQDFNARIDKAAYLAAAGKDDDALALLEETVQLNPTNALARSNLGSLLSRKGRGPEALTHYRAALETDPDNPDTRHNYALALSRNNRPVEAQKEFEEVLRRKPTHHPAAQQLAWLLATRPECLNQTRALALAKVLLKVTQAPAALDVAAAAYAANGDFEEAARLATQATQAAHEAKIPALEDAVRARLQLYRTGQPYLQPVASTPGR